MASYSGGASDQDNELLAQGYVVRAPKRTPSGTVKIEKKHSEVHKQIRDQAHKQLNERCSLQEQLQKHKDFCTPVKYDQERRSIQGLVPLQTYKEIEAKEEVTFELRSCGLSDGEIKLWLEHHEQEKASGNVISTSKLEEVIQKIEKKKSQLQKEPSFAGKLKIPRREMELEKALGQDETSKKLRNMLLEVEPSTSYPEGHPMNHVNELLQTVTSNAKPLSRKEKKKQKKLEKKQEEKDKLELQMSGLDPSACMECFKLQHKDKGFVGPLKKNQLLKHTMCLSCRQKLEEVDDESDDEIETIPDEIIEQYRLTIEQIKEIPRFHNYDPGKLSKVLFLKNLSTKVTEQDLRAIFHKYDSPAVPNSYRLLTGRMKGQAFVTFKDESTAAKALQHANGYDFKGKPIIIEYGKLTR